jgi:hypothetical protein
LPIVNCRLPISTLPRAAFKNWQLAIGN